MHFEILVEDSSGQKLLDSVLPKIFGGQHGQHSWRSHSYKGIGRIPKSLAKQTDPTKRMLLDQLPRILRGYGRTPGIDAVVVVLDTDTRDCAEFMRELTELASNCNLEPCILFCFATEEIEAWYLGDRIALGQAYPNAKNDVLNKYIQDSICNTWELLADAIYPGGSAAIRKAGWPLPGQVKHEWAQKIGPLRDLDRNTSPSFDKFLKGIRQLVI